MSTAQAERAISQLYESDSLRSELRDEEASLLLMWGEARLKELADRDLPNSQFDHLSEKFRSLLAAVNICVGKRKTSPSQHLPMMANISSAAEAAGFIFTPDNQTTFLKQQSALTNQDAISELLGLLKPSDGTMPSSPIMSQAAAESVASPPNNIGEAIAEPATPQSSPAVVESNQPAQLEALPRVEPASHNVSETAAESIASQPPQPEVSPAPQPPAQNVSETVEIVMPQPPPAIEDHTQPPQPEDLPEFPKQSPPQEGKHDV